MHFRNRKISLIFAFGFIFSIFYFLFSRPVFAAELNAVSQFQQMGIGQNFRVDISLDTQNEEINAVEGIMTFSGKSLEVAEIRDGGSIVSLWIKKPTLEDACENICKIFFSGIIPNGYAGSNGLIFSVIFKTKEAGRISGEIVDATVLSNDGKGTPAKLTTNDFSFRVSENVALVQDWDKEKIDTTPPESFTFYVTSEANLFNGKRFLVFAAQDRGVGIARYEIKEGDAEKWMAAESPYLLKDQKAQEIALKAIDKAGNERVEVLFPQTGFKGFKKYGFLGIIIVGVLLLFSIFRLIKRKRQINDVL